MLYEILKYSIIAYMFSVLIGPDNIFSFYGKLINNLPEWLWKPLGGCRQCFAGQVCFWGYLIIHSRDYEFINHLFFAAMGIFLTYIYDIIYERAKKN